MPNYTIRKVFVVEAASKEEAVAKATADPGELLEYVRVSEQPSQNSMRGGERRCGNSSRASEVSPNDSVCGAGPLPLSRGGPWWCGVLTDCSYSSPEVPSRPGAPGRCQSRPSPLFVTTELRGDGGGVILDGLRGSSGLLIPPNFAVFIGDALHRDSLRQNPLEPASFLIKDDRVVPVGFRTAVDGHRHRKFHDELPFGCHLGARVGAEPAGVGDAELPVRLRQGVLEGSPRGHRIAAGAVIILIRTQWLIAVVQRV